MTVRLEAIGLGVRADRAVLVDDVDLRLHAGEVVAVVGPNGAGKSTLVAALAGDHLPGTTVSGMVVLDGRPLHQWTDAEQGRRRAVLGQDHGVGLAFTAEAVVRMGRAPWWRHGDDATDDAAVASALARTATVDLADRDVTRLSGGERSRVGLARCLAQDTPVLLLDEPTAALDLRHQVATLDLARRLAVDGAAVLAVLHDLALAARFADRIVLMDRGGIRADGPPAAVLDADLLSAVYGCLVDVLAHPLDGVPIVVPRPAPEVAHVARP